jgi:hypothetical protein
LASDYGLAGPLVHGLLQSEAPTFCEALALFLSDVKKRGPEVRLGELETLLNLGQIVDQVISREADEPAINRRGDGSTTKRGVR